MENAALVHEYAMAATPRVVDLLITGRSRRTLADRSQAFG